MDLRDAKRIGHHLQGQAQEGDPADPSASWAFAHTVSHLPGPIEKAAIHFVGNRPAAYWIADGVDVCLLFSVSGWLKGNDRSGEPFVEGTVKSWPLLPDQWLVSLESSYGRHERGAIAFENQWRFQQREGTEIVVKSEREWDGGDDWVVDDGERFARLLAEKLKWGGLPT